MLDYLLVDSIINFNKNITHHPCMQPHPQLLPTILPPAAYPSPAAYPPPAAYPAYSAPSPTYPPPPPAPTVITINGNNNNSNDTPCLTCAQNTPIMTRKKLGCVAIAWCCCLLLTVGAYGFMPDPPLQ